MSVEEKLVIDRLYLGIMYVRSQYAESFANWVLVLLYCSLFGLFVDSLYVGLVIMTLTLD